MYKESKTFYIFIRCILFVIWKTFFFFKAKGRSFVPQDGGCVIASNHLSHLDPIVLALGSPRILSFLAKEELFVGIFGKLIAALNAFPLQRGKGDIKAIRVSLDKLKRQQTLIIFPEGTRSLTGELKQAQLGIGMIAAKSGVPVVPTLIEGSNKALPAHEKKIHLFVPIKIYFGKPLTFASLNLDPRNKDNYQIFADAVIAAIQELKDKISPSAG